MRAFTARVQVCKQIDIEIDFRFKLKITPSFGVGLNHNPILMLVCEWLTVWMTSYDCHYAHKRIGRRVDIVCSHTVIEFRIHFNTTQPFYQ
jgi:hypothetical protein